jgi:tetratricopeptide (TPR) repeat protein
VGTTYLSRECRFASKGFHPMVQPQRSIATGDVRYLARGHDPVVRWLWLAILLLIVVGLTALAYGLLVGFLDPPAPRTWVESRIVVLADAITRYPGSGDARRDYILALGVAGQPDRALTELAAAKGVVKGVELTKVYAGAVEVLFQSGQYDQAITLGKEAIAADDKAREARIVEVRKKGIVYDNSDFDQSARVSILFSMARASGAQGEWTKAVGYLSSAIELSPRAADLLTYRADAYSRLGDTAKARADLTKALSFGPDNVEAKRLLEQLGGG